MSKISDLFEMFESNEPEDENYYYHLSFNKNSFKYNPKTNTYLIEPRQVNQKFEPSTKRICVAPSINDCLNAVNGSMTPFYVFRVPVSKVKSDSIIRNKIVCKFVPDAYVTNEVWIIKPTEFECIGKIQVTTVPRVTKVNRPNPYLKSNRNLSDELRKRASDNDYFIFDYNWLETYK